MEPTGLPCCPDPVQDRVQQKGDQKLREQVRVSSEQAVNGRDTLWRPLGLSRADKPIPGGAGTDSGILRRLESKFRGASVHPACLHVGLMTCLSCSPSAFRSLGLSVHLPLLS